MPETRLQVTVVNLEALFDQRVRYEMPPSQRPYVWELERQWEPLWNDVQEVAEHHLAASMGMEESPSRLRDKHFLGAAVLHQTTSQTGRVLRP